ncbi:hypothetical protein, partial [Paracoccus sp. PAR01]|uniref:hypothetical protein n=1 Tax=Paracoccus sp. PAR01 TaxID=2769282 RepID=UPI001CE1CDEE
CFRMNAFCASVNFDAFIVFSSSPSRGRLAENSSFKRSSFQGAEQHHNWTSRSSIQGDDQRLPFLGGADGGGFLSVRHPALSRGYDIAPQRLDTQQGRMKSRPTNQAAITNEGLF